MDKLDVLEELFDKKVLAILRKFYEMDTKEFYVRELSRLTKVSLATTFRVIRRLVDIKLVEEIKISKFKVYKLGDNEATRFLGQFIKKQKQALQVFITRVKDINGLHTVMLQGKEQKNSANVILIGVNLDQTKIKHICAEIKEQLNYIVSPLAVSYDQFQQMQQMYPIKTKVLYESG